MGIVTRASRRRISAAHERGAVAVEFALVLPMLIMLLLGVTTTGLTYSDHLAITNAVREGSRLGASIEYDKTTAPTITGTQWADAVQERVRQVYFNRGSSLAVSQVCVLLVDSAGAPEAEPTTQGSSCGDAPPGPATPAVSPNACVVKVWVQKPGKITLGVFPALEPTLRAEAVAYYGRTSGVCATT